MKLSLVAAVVLATATLCGQPPVNRRRHLWTSIHLFGWCRSAADTAGRPAPNKRRRQVRQLLSGWRGRENESSRAQPPISTELP